MLISLLITVISNLMKMTHQSLQVFLSLQTFQQHLSKVHVSKIFEKIICSQLSNHFDNILSEFQCGFRKGHSPQHCLLLIIDKWKKTVNNHKVFGAVLTDLSKAFYCICHDLLIVKLNVYGLSLPALKLITDYL